MPCGVRDFHAGADVDAEAERALQRHGLLADHLAAQRVRGEVLHRDGVVALDEQEVVDADDVVVRDLARVAQLMHEALHDLFVFRDVRVQELEDEPLVDHGVFHEEHRAERALADAFDVLVAALDDVAGLEGLDVELLRARHLSACLTAFCDFLLGHQQGARRLLRRRRGAEAGGRRFGAWTRRRRGGRRRHLRMCPIACVAPSWRGARCRCRTLKVGTTAASTTDGCRSPRSASPDRTARAAPPAPRSVRCCAVCPWICTRMCSSRRSSASLASEVDGLEADLLLFALQHGQHGIDDLVVAEAAERAHHHRQGARRRGLEHFEQARHGAFAADFGERVHGAFADPPVLVLGGVDEVADGAVVLGLVEDLDRRRGGRLRPGRRRAAARPRRPSVRRSCRVRRRRGCAPTSRRPRRPRAVP